MKLIGSFLLSYIVAILIALCIYFASYLNWIRITFVVPLLGLLERITIPKELLVSGKALLRFVHWCSVVYVAILLFKSTSKWLSYAVLFYLDFAAEKVLDYIKKCFKLGTLTSFILKINISHSFICMSYFKF